MYNKDGSAGITDMEFEKKRWLHMIATMLIALCSGIGYAWSVFQKPLLENFGWTLNTISITFTLQIMISTIAPVFLSRFQKILGVRNYLRIGIFIYVSGLVATMFTSSIGYLYIIYGLVVGLGIAILYPTLMAYATSLFPDKTGMASGLLSGAYGCGAVLWAPIATILMRNYNVLSTFGVLALIFAIVMIPATFFIVRIPDNFNPKVMNEKKRIVNIRTEKEYVWKEMIKSPKYYVLLIVLTLGATAGLMIAGHASGMLQEVLLLRPEQAAILVGFFSAFNTLGRLVFGLLSDRIGRYPVMMILFIVICCSMVVMYMMSGVLFIIALLVTSSCYGGFTAMFSPLCADNFGLKNLGVNYAFLYIAYGLAGLVGPQLASRIHEASGGYNTAFLFVAGMAVVGLLLVVFLKVKQKVR